MFILDLGEELKELLLKVGAGFRSIMFSLDKIAYSFIDDAYKLIIDFGSGRLLDSDVVNRLLNNVYIIVGLFAFFRLALLLINSILSPDKLFAKEDGIGKIVINIFITMILFIFVPTFFNLGYEAQKVIMDGNYINKIFGLNDIKSSDPGYVLKVQTITALIYPDEEFANKDAQNFEENGFYTYDPKGELCKNPTIDYNGIFDGKNYDAFDVISKNIAENTGDIDNPQWCYNYTLLITFVTGIFITYVLLSYAIDIAIRAIELIFLEIVSPLFIVTFIDPKSSKSGGYFYNWLTTTLKVYASLFIKIASVALMIIFISLIPDIITNLKLNGLIPKLILIFAILIFAKKIPGLLAKLLGMDEKDLSPGGIMSKLGSAALLGGLATGAANRLKRAGTAALGAGASALRTQRAIRKSNRAQKSDLKKDKGLTYKDRINKAKEAGRTGSKSYFGNMRDSMKESKRALKDELKDNKLNMKSNLAKGLAGTGIALAAGAKVGYNAENAKAAISGTKESTNNIKNELGLSEGRLSAKVQNISDSISSGIRKPFGTIEEISEVQETLKNNRTAYSYLSNTSKKVASSDTALNKNTINSAISVGSDGTVSFGNIAGQIPISQGAVNSFISKTGSTDKTGIYASVYATANGYTSMSKSSDGSYSFKSSDGSIVNLTSEQLKNNCGGALSQEGMHNLEQKINSYQASVVDRYSQMQTTVDSYQTSIMQSQQQIANLNTRNDSLKEEGVKILKTTKAMFEGLSTPFDGRDFDISIDSAIGELYGLKESAVNEEEAAGFEKRIKDLQSAKEQMSDVVTESRANNDSKGILNTNIANIKAHIDSITAEQKRMEVWYNNAEGSTVSEKKYNLDLEKSSIEKKLKVYEKEDKK